MLLFSVYFVRCILEVCFKKFRSPSLHAINMLQTWHEMDRCIITFQQEILTINMQICVLLRCLSKEIFAPNVIKKA